MLFIVGDVIRYVYPVNDTLASQAVQASAIADNISSIASEHQSNFSDALLYAEAVLEETEAVAADLEQSLMYTRAQENQTSDLFDRYVALESEVEELRVLVEELKAGHAEVEAVLSQASEIADELALIVSEINQIIAESTEKLDDADSLSAQTYGDLMVAWDYIDALDTLIGETPDPIYGSGSGSGMESGSESGSGMESGSDSSFGMEPGSIGIEPEPDVGTIAGGVVTLQLALDQLESSVNECAPVIAEAEQHATDLEQMGEEIERWVE